MALGQRIKVSRHALGLSLRDLESKIDNRVTAQAISKYERDESVPSSGVLIALADALEVTMDYLASLNSHCSCQHDTFALFTGKQSAVGDDRATG